MPRHAWLDAPGTLHHVMVRGIERRPLFRDDTDRAEFVARLAASAERGAFTVYAWALLPSHAHLLVQTAAVTLTTNMPRLLTDSVVNVNRWHKRVGPLVQNRYNSSVVEAEPYLLELVRYLHLNPLRARLVPDLGQWGACRASSPSRNGTGQHLEGRPGEPRCPGALLLAEAQAGRRRVRGEEFDGRPPGV